MNKTNNTKHSTSTSAAPRSRRGRSQRRPRVRGGATNARPRSPQATRGNRPGGKPTGTGKPARRTGGRRRNNNFRRRPDKAPALTHRIVGSDEKTVAIPEITDEDTVRVIPVSGVEEIGRNMNIIETKDDIIVIDAGFQFVSRESKAPGIDYILPNTQYLEERKHKIRALVVTHGHLDHIGGIPFIMERIGNPPIYTQYLTSLMILKRQEEFPQMDPVQMNVVKEGESFTVGSTKIKTFPVTHSIPDAMGVAIETKHGNVVVTGDIKLVHEDGKVVVEERQEWEKVAEEKTLALLCDSTNADRGGFSASEQSVFETLEDIIRKSKTRLIIGAFASQFERFTNIIKVCEEMGKKVVLEGRSMKTNMEIALTAELIKVKPDTIIDSRNLGDYPSDRIVILSTGSQGEEFAALMRMSTGKHKTVTLNERDTIVLSSSVVPGNEIAVQLLKDNLYRHNVKVINYRSDHVHSSGHGNAGELVWISQTLKPEFLVTVHGHHFHLKSHRQAAIENGFPADKIIVPDNGTIIDIKNGEVANVQPMKIPNELLMVDGFTVGTRQEVVLRDRQTLAEDGMFVIIATVNTKNGKLRKSPDIISRGFVYLRENQQLLSEARVLIKKTVEKQTEHMHPLDLEIVKDELADVVSGFLLQKTQKNPMVIPVLIGI